MRVMYIFNFKKILKRLQIHSRIIFTKSNMFLKRYIFANRIMNCFCFSLLLYYYHRDSLETHNLAKVCSFNCDKHDLTANQYVRLKLKQMSRRLLCPFCTETMDYYKTSKLLYRQFIKFLVILL